jgi:hypothetical protein
MISPIPRYSNGSSAIRPARSGECSSNACASPTRDNGNQAAIRIEFRPCPSSLSTVHERMMKDAVHPEGRTDLLPAQLAQADLQKLTKSMEKNQTFLVADHA